MINSEKLSLFRSGVSSKGLADIPLDNRVRKYHPSKPLQKLPGGIGGEKAWINWACYNNNINEDPIDAGADNFPDLATAKEYARKRNPGCVCYAWESKG